ncbi:glycosyl hydrolase family 65 protein [Micromonospora sp. LOL_024]|uniref:glycosyl hydrolase family 65 protein n=1 Tax=Micromonospora sp. LOL_024 TaxID=3345412 RepID=UPI003A835872
MHPTPDRPARQPDERWRIRRTRDDLDRLGETESIFALSNGWLGWRGTLDEGAPCEMPGSYLNGLHERRELTYGLHLASLGGEWLALVQGFGGLRDDRELLSFDPRLPRRIDRLAFSLRWHGHRLLVMLTADEVRYELPDAAPGAAMELWHHGERVRVTAGGPVGRPMPTLPALGDEPPSPPGRRPTRR